MLLLPTGSEHHFLHHLHDDDDKGEGKRPGQPLSSNNVIMIRSYTCACHAVRKRPRILLSAALILS